MAYLTIQELPRFGVSIKILEDFDDDEIQTAIDIASSEADTYLSAYYESELTTYPAALKKHVGSAVLKHLLDTRGRSPLGEDKLIDDNYASALSFYKALQKSEQHLPDTATAPEAGAHVVVAVRQRGW